MAYHEHIFNSGPKHGLEVGQEVEIEGRRYWITKIVNQNLLEVMPDPDDRKKFRNNRSNFWPTFWVIVLIIVILRMVF